MHYKIPLELNICNEEDMFLNFWDSNHSHDVVCAVKDGKLFLVDNEGNPTDEEISLKGYINLVKAVVESE